MAERKTALAKFGFNEAESFLLKTLKDLAKEHGYKAYFSCSFITWNAGSDLDFKYGDDEKFQDKKQMTRKQLGAVFTHYSTKRLLENLASSGKVESVQVYTSNHFQNYLDSYRLKSKRNSKS